jgi:hypothetical protein
MRMEKQTDRETDRQTEGQTDEIKLIVPYRSFSKAHKNTNTYENTDISVYLFKIIKAFFATVRLLQQVFVYVNYFTFKFRKLRLSTSFSQLKLLLIRFF